MSTLIHTAPGIGHFVKEHVDEVEKRISNHMLQDFVTFRGLADEKVLVSPKKVCAIVERKPPDPVLAAANVTTVYGTTGGFFDSNLPPAETSE